MKRLSEESADEFTRALLRAGSDLSVNGEAKARLLETVSSGVALASGLHLTRAARFKALIGGKAAKVSMLLALAGGGGAAYLSAQSSKSEPAPTVQLASNAPSGSAMAEPAPHGLPPDRPAAQEAMGQQLPSPTPTSSPNVPVVTASSALRRPTLTGRSASQPPESTSPSSELLREVQLVEALRQAIHRGQSERVEQLFTEYRRQFGSGQLRPEVAKLAATWMQHGQETGSP
jgi:hypothetical protein